MRGEGGLQIGDLILENGLVLGPMAGVTDLPYRLLCKEQGCGLMEIHKEEGPVAVQLFGSDPEILGEIAAQVAEGPCACIDLNMGCPVPKIVKNGEGSALMREPRRVEAILSSMVGHVKKPVTVKIRKGFDAAHVNAVEIAKIAESCGVAAVAVHGRTREQYYAGKADWEIIRQVKEAVKIPVIGNGDVFTPQDAERLLEETGCDGVMIARGARGDPWIFSRTLHYLKTGELLPAPTPEEIKAKIYRHGKLLTAYKGEKPAMCQMRKHVAWYTAGLPHSSALRGEISRMETLEELARLLEDRLTIR